MNLNGSKSTISRIANKLGKQRQLGLLNGQKPKFYRPRHVATPAVVRLITSYISKENPPTISLMAVRYNISVGTAVSIIHDIIHAKCRKKRPVHRLCPDVIEKRRSGAWRMYRRLFNEKYKNYVTTDEAWFYLDGRQSVSDMYYVRSDGLPEEAGVSTHGKTQLHFVEHGSTITSRYYIEHIIEPFIKYDIPRLFPGDTQKKMILHQDNAPGHAGKGTLSCMKEKKIQVITPTE
ncbi:unnamed protein product [Rotaria sp. Silwood1]|nr:unnamed protein product [Rotaria sp. Silwood1]CAF4813122.1 unnamed protein product [Rotaria sp. Silwood1]